MDMRGQKNPDMAQKQRVFDVPHKMGIYQGPPFYSFIDQDGNECVYDTCAFAVRLLPVMPTMDVLFRKAVNLWLKGMRSAIVLRIGPECELIKDEGNRDFISRKLLPVEDDIYFSFYVRFWSKDYETPHCLLFKRPAGGVVPRYGFEEFWNAA